MNWFRRVFKTGNGNKGEDQTVIFSLGVLFGFFALVYNEGEQLVNAGIKGVKLLVHSSKFLVHSGKPLVHSGKLLVHSGKTIIHFTMKRINAGIEMLKAAVYLVLKMLNFSIEFFGALLDNFVNDFQCDFSDCGMNEVFHIEDVYHMNTHSSNGLLFTHDTVPYDTFPMILSSGVVFCGCFAGSGVFLRPECLTIS